MRGNPYPGTRAFRTEEEESFFGRREEVGHVTARHVNERISRQMIVSGAAAAVAIGAQMSDRDVIRYGVPAVVGVGAGAYLLKFGRDQESEADALGMRYMARAGYNPFGAYAAMGVLAEAASDTQRPPEFLSTHPSSDTRIENLISEWQKTLPLYNAAVAEGRTPDCGGQSPRYVEDVSAESN